ncbi:hypothetical protein [Candidatus Hodgkinia cicadicola]|uniref:hypothetical protein n=1 Tax=Candidatus Hodgkinia cicadicola TaxID=573658 RepID=UPI001788DE57
MVWCFIPVCLFLFVCWLVVFMVVWLGNCLELHDVGIECFVDAGRLGHREDGEKWLLSVGLVLNKIVVVFGGG